MGKIYSISFAIFGVLLLLYLALPSPQFPVTLWDYLESTEPADHENPLRRGYYTNITREQLMSHYTLEFGWGLRLNYPPEYADFLVRDQTKSSFLEEVVHPLRESIYINGYTPRPDQEILTIKGVKYDSKVIVKYVRSNTILRLFIGICGLGLFWLLSIEWVRSIKSFKWTSR